LKKKLENLFVPESATQELFIELWEKCDGLVHISEIDAPYEPFILSPDALGRSQMIEDYMDPGKTKMLVRLDAAHYFEKLTRRREWHTAAHEEQIKKITELYDLLNLRLTDLTVYRVGEIQIDIYIVGRDPKGCLVGVRTRAVET
jgi:hypothetical protein